MRISAKVDYALRALTELAIVPPDAFVKGKAIAAAQGISVNFLENILRELRDAGMVRGVRGADGGYALARPAAEISIADVIRTLEGPLAAVQGVRPDELTFGGPATELSTVWLAVRARLREILDVVSVADVANGTLPLSVRALALNQS